MAVLLAHQRPVYRWVGTDEDVAPAELPLDLVSKKVGAAGVSPELVAARLGKCSADPVFHQIHQRAGIKYADRASSEREGCPNHPRDGHDSDRQARQKQQPIKRLRPVEAVLCSAGAGWQNPLNHAHLFRPSIVISGSIFRLKGAEITTTHRDKQPGDIAISRVATDFAAGPRKESLLWGGQLVFVPCHRSERGHS